MTLETTRSIEMAGGTSQPILYALVLDFLASLKINPQLSVLDVGCGQGDLLYQLKLREFKNLFGCDGIKNPTRIPPGASYVQTDLRSERLPFQEQKFDVVLSIEVIEHLENPRAHVRELSRLCQNGGLVILSTPNVENWFSKLSFCLRGTFQYFGPKDYPAHITPVLPVDLKRIFVEAGLEDFSVQFSGQGRIPGFKTFWQQMGGTYLGSKLFTGKAFSDQIFIIAKKSNASGR